MKMYLSADSKKNIGYTPDWIQIGYSENGKYYYLTLDYQGETDYAKTKINCRCKGTLTPWTLWDCEKGKETNLSSLTEEELKKQFPLKKILKIFHTGLEFNVGLHPVSSIPLSAAANDIISNGQGTCEYMINGCPHVFNFKFNSEVNL